MIAGREDGIGVRFFSENYAALPEMAGDQLLAALNDLPEASDNLLLHAFLGEQILIAARRELQELLREENHMQEMLDEAAGPDVDLRESLKIDPSLLSKDVQRAISRENDDAQRAAEQSIRKEMGDIDDKVTESFQDQFRVGPSNLDREISRLSRMAPVECYRTSMRILCRKIIEITSTDGRREILDKEKCATDGLERYPSTIMGLVSALRGPSDDDKEQEQDD